jgi:hypothetical protein
VSPVPLAAGAEFMRRLAKEGFRPILIGGLAMEAAGFGGTKDADALLRVEEFDGIEFLHTGGFRVISAAGWVTNGVLTLPNGTQIPFDVLHPSKFVGRNHSGEEFFDFVARTAKKTSYGLVATPGVVYYTRLLVDGPHGELYLERIRRDMDGGAPLTWLTAATRIARRFGTSMKVRPKVARIRSETATSV